MLCLRRCRSVEKRTMFLFLRSVVEGRKGAEMGARGGASIQNGITRESLARESLTRKSLNRESLERNSFARDLLSRDSLARESVARESLAR